MAILFRASSALALLAVALAAQAASPGYLNSASLAYTPPPPPGTGSEITRMDLAMVRANQATSASQAWLEADGDARAYNADAIIGRFDDAWGGGLNAANRPILVRVLSRIIQDTGSYAATAKKANPRDRPYVGNPDITPCNTAYLKPGESYPSGHAMNGYVVGSVLADLRPSRQQALLSRGIRYGDNRVVCGVHHPIDVQQGRLLGIAYLEAVRASPDFKTEFQCALEEDRNLADPTHAIPADCKKLVAPEPARPVSPRVKPPTLALPPALKDAAPDLL